MKVTAIIPDELINEIIIKTQAKNITESLKLALTDWLKIQKLKDLNSCVKNNPLDFGYSAESLRELNRIR